MSGLSQAAQDAIAEIEAGPKGPKVGAFFDLDGTLVAGYTAATFYGDRLRHGDVGVGDFLKTVVNIVDGEVLGGDPTRVAYQAFAALRGQSEEVFAELGERLFRQKIAGTIRNESRALVRAHKAMGHTVAIASAATKYQIGPIARDLGIDDLICTQLEVEDGVFTGAPVGAMLWGKHKATGVREFAKKRKVSLPDSYAYGNGYEDVAFLSTVGHPTALSPHRGLREAAQRLGWPVLDLQDPPKSGLGSIARTAAALYGMNAAVTAGVALGVVSGDRRRGMNTAISLATGLPMALAGVEINVLNEERLWSHRPSVFVVNHQSALDIVVMGALLKEDFTIVAKKEARFDPRAMVGSLLIDPVFIDRSNSEQARASLNALAERVQGGTSLLIFPEGTRSNTSVMGPFRKGAFHLAVQAGVPIVPVVLRNTGELMNKSSFVLNPGVVDVAVLEPEDDWTLENMNERVTALHRKFEETLAKWPEGDE